MIAFLFIHSEGSGESKSRSLNKGIRISKSFLRRKDSSIDCLGGTNNTNCYLNGNATSNMHFQRQIFVLFQNFMLLNIFSIKQCRIKNNHWRNPIFLSFIHHQTIHSFPGFIENHKAVFHSFTF